MVTRERVEGIVRTALITHMAKHGVWLPEPDDFLKRIGDAYDESVRNAQAVEAGTRLPELEQSVESAFQGNPESGGFWKGAVKR